MNKTKQCLHVAIIGNIDAGKSTLIGHMIEMRGEIPLPKMKQLEEQAKLKNMDSFKYAWILDRLILERDRGLTIDLTYYSIFELNTQIAFIDSPGHFEFIKNMIIATSQANTALLVVSAADKEFEYGMSDKGTTKKHLLLSYTLGIKHILVAINKMDLVGYSEERFMMISEIIKGILSKLKYTNVKIIPVSGWIGDNILKLSDKMKWYSGASLLQALCEISINDNHNKTSKEVYKIGELGYIFIKGGNTPLPHI